MSLILLELQADILEYAKSMPERSVADDLDFEVWGKGFCERMVRFHMIFLVFYADQCCIGGLRRAGG
jgi:hypothetical protein